MKTLLILLSLSLSFFAIADQNAEVQYTIENYQDFINKLGIHNCNLQDADLRGVDLQEAKLIGADLRGAFLQDADLRGANLLGADFTGAKVTQRQAEYLKAKGLSGFFVVVK